MEAANFTIKRDQIDSDAVNYQKLLEQGMLLAGKYSGEIWTNFNHSDPGVTILQNLCYALTELGYKTELPIADLLTNKYGKIEYHDHFFKPEKALTTSPVLIKDYKKLILNEFPFVKQIYFQSYQMSGARYWLQPLIEINTLAYHVNQKAELIDQVDLFLTQYTNMGIIFAPAVNLQSQEVVFSGKIYIDDQADVEMTIARLIYAVNNYYSAFPVYQSYSDLIKKGADPSILFEGPYLSGGYIADEYLSDKVELISIENISDTILGVDGIAFVESMKFDNQANPSKLTVDRRNAPVMSLDRMCLELTKLRIFKYGKLVTEFEFDKIKQYFNQLLSYQKKQDLSKLLPKGSYSNVSDYYSFQNQFPNAYHLTNISSNQPSRNAQTLQLKGYLMFFDQLMLDYLAQLSHLPELFSFQSGRNSSEVSSRTYYQQPVYDVPGAKYILKDAEVFVTSVSSRGNRDENWNLYQKDHQNPYYKTLTSSKISSQENQDRKSGVLKHLLARVGLNYPNESLFYTNPSYGGRESDIIDHASRALLNFEQYSANKIRGYYKIRDSIKFVGGFERNLDQKLGLTSHFRGVSEKLSHGIEQQNPSIVIKVDGYVVLGDDAEINELKRATKPTNQKVEVFSDSKKELEFSLNKDQKVDPSFLKQTVRKRCAQLNELVTSYEGFVLVDHTRLLKVLKISLSLDDLVGVPYSFDVFSQIILGLMSGDSVRANKVNGIYRIIIKTQGDIYILFDSIDSRKTVLKVFKQLDLFRKGKANQLVICAGNNTDSVRFDSELLHSSTAFFPGYVSMMQEEAFQQYLVNEMMVQAPGYQKVNAVLLGETEMNDLLTDFDQWMNWLKAEYGLNNYDITEEMIMHIPGVAFRILKNYVL